MNLKFDVQCLMKLNEAEVLLTQFISLYDRVVNFIATRVYPVPLCRNNRWEHGLET